MIEVINLLTGLWLCFWALNALILLQKPVYHSILFLLIVHFFLNGLPLLLNVFIGEPEYLRFPGFRLATNDLTTNLLYCVYVSIIPVFWWKVGRIKLTATDWNNQHVPLLFTRAKLMLYVLIVSPLIAVFLAPDPELYLNYGWVAAELDTNVTIIKHHSIVALFSTLSIISSLLLLLLIDKFRFSSLILILPWLLLAIWLNSKRYLVALVVVGIWYALWRRGKLAKFDIVLAGILLSALFFLYSVIYQSEVRLNELNDLQRTYENFRIDYGRDSRIKMTIYAELNPDEIQILEYRGQSIIFTLTMYLPRDLWPEKPYPYAVYFTSAMFRISPRLLGWGMTTSWLEEAIANFSWLGLIFGPLVPAVICRIGDSRNSAIVSTLTVITSSVLLVVQVVAFAPFFILWIASVIRFRPHRVEIHERYHHT